MPCPNCSIRHQFRTLQRWECARLRIMPECYTCVATLCNDSQHRLCNTFAACIPAPQQCSPCFARLSAWPGPIAPSWCAVRHSQENICPTIIHYNSWNVTASSLRSIRIRAVKLRQRQHSASAPRCGAHSTNTISSRVTFSIEERTWRWRARAWTGSRGSTFWKGTCLCCWSMPGISKRCRGARPLCATANGWPTSCGTDE